MLRFVDCGDSMPHLIAIPVKRVSTRASLISPAARLQPSTWNNRRENFRPQAPVAVSKNAHGDLEIHRQMLVNL